MFVDFNLKKNQYLLYSYSLLIETRYSFLFSELGTCIYISCSQMKISGFLCGHILNALYGLKQYFLLPD